MNDKKKTLSDSSLDNISEEHISGMADSLCEKAIGDTNSDNSITAKGKKRGKFSIFALVVSIAAIIGVVVITGVIISNSGFFYARNFRQSSSKIYTISCNIRTNFRFKLVYCGFNHPCYFCHKWCHCVLNV